MSVPNSMCHAPLPRSFYFLTVSRGNRTRTVAVRVALARTVMLLSAAFGLLGLGAILCLLFHDDLVASLMARQSQMQYAYEDRIDALRSELQQQATRQTRDQASVETKLHDLMSRAFELEGRNAVLASLAPRSLALQAPRRVASDPPAPGAGVPLPKAVLGQRPATLPPSVIGFAPLPPAPDETPSPKPHPEADSDNPRPEAVGPVGHVSALEPGRTSLSRQLATVTDTLDGVEQAQVGALMHMGSAARQETARLSAVLDDVGLTPERFRRVAPAATDVGGPFVPLPEAGDGAFGTAMAKVQSSLLAAAHLRHAVAQVPLVSPVGGSIEVTSPFGARIDPFLGRPALHTGVDLRESFGVGAKATAAGRVTFAGALGGYGNMVEIDHGNGLATRYAHLEAILVSVGQTVARGDVVGEVGATGRATGPHLHYEVRIDGEPVDPMRFIAWNGRIAALSAQ
ncbi:MAG TPA: peptidoglycan DD-metalloendopeptidase family protein [Lichenihabitans sp.]|jgi:murein DD-endopeptidase MepM/ murein hydrolase activator NlpD|nr:peptidoglycan DD-metalloendopeptidase family protein [Lichenihabitans sp.]